MNVISQRNKKFQDKHAKRTGASGRIKAQNAIGNFFWKLVILAVVVFLGYLASPYILVWYRHITNAIE